MDYLQYFVIGAFIVAFLMGWLAFESEKDDHTEALAKARKQRDQLHREIDEYIDKMSLDMQNPIEHRAVVERPPKRAIEEQMEKLADVRNRAFPPPDPSTANPELEPYYPPPPSWEKFARSYPPPPPPQ